MKKIVSLLVAFAFLIVTVRASETTIESSLIYTQEDNYWISIPETIMVGEECSVEATEVNIAPDKTIYVDLGIPEDYVKIYSNFDNTKSLNVYFMSEEGQQVSAANSNIVRFESGTHGSKSFSTYINDTSDAIAGQYTGSVTFNIHCD